MSYVNLSTNKIFENTDHFYNPYKKITSSKNPRQRALITVIFLLHTGIIGWLIWATVRIFHIEKEINCFVCDERATDYISKHGNLCCFNNDVHFRRALVDTYTRSLGISSIAHSNQCSAHLFLNGKSKNPHSDNKNVDNQNEDAYSSVEGWTFRSYGAHIISECLELESDGLKIKTTGLYLAYSHLAYVPPTKLKENYKEDLLNKEAFILGQQVTSNQDILLKQSQIVWFHWYPDPKQNDTKVVPVNNNHNHNNYNLNVNDHKHPSSYYGCNEERGSFYTSNLFGLIHLEEGSTLRVESKRPSWVCRSNKASYFGLIKLF